LSKGAEAIASPLRRAAANLTSSFEAGGRAVTGEAAGAETGVAASAGSVSSDGPPAWARRMRRSQTISHGTSAATHAVKSGDGGGAGASVDLSEGE
jgi:type IV secretion system protein TrbL